MKLFMPLKYRLALLGLAAAAFVFNTSEFMPIGLLIDISASFGMSEAETGLMITVYAWMVALLSLPLMLLTCHVELKKLMLATITVFAAGQILSGIAINFPMLMAARICVACAHSIFWSIAAPLAARLVTRIHQPLALSIIATGSAIAMIMGLPLGRVIGLYAGWRMTFMLIGIISVCLLLYLAFILPKRKQNKTFGVRDLPHMLKSPGVSIVYLITVLFATAYYTTYSYIEPFLYEVAGFSAEMITAALVLLGICGFLGSVLFSKLYGRMRLVIIRTSLLGICAALLLWGFVAANTYLMFFSCMMLGIFSTLFNITFQAEILKLVNLEASTVAMSIFSGIFNLGIGSGTWLGGELVRHGNLALIGFAGAGIVAAAVFICFLFYLPAIAKTKYHSR